MRAVASWAQAWTAGHTPPHAGGCPRANAPVRPCPTTFQSSKIFQAPQFLPTDRFVLREKRGEPAEPGGAAADAAGDAAGGAAAPTGGWALEDLPSATACGDEVFLANLGYAAPGPYELLIAAAPQAGLGLTGCRQAHRGEGKGGMARCLACCRAAGGAAHCGASCAWCLPCRCSQPLGC